MLALLLPVDSIPPNGTQPPHSTPHIPVWIYRIDPNTGAAHEMQGPVQPTTGGGMNAFGTDVAVSRKGDVIVVSGRKCGGCWGCMYVCAQGGGGWVVGRGDRLRVACAVMILQHLITTVI
jgi:hypothetical protein